MLNVIYEDKDKIIVNKPAGQLSQSARGFDMDLVSEWVNDSGIAAVSSHETRITTTWSIPNDNAR